MKLLMLILFFPFSFEGENGRELLDTALEKCSRLSSIGNMGPGLGETGPAYSWNALPDAAKWLLSFLMLLGRLELFTVLLLFTPDFWKRN